MYDERQRTEDVCLPEKWKLPRAWAEWALKERNDWVIDHVKATAKLFHGYHTEKKNKRPSVQEWEMAWKSWVRRQKTEFLRVRVKGVHWWESAKGIEEKGKELGITQGGGELFPFFKNRVFVAAGNGPWNLNHR